MKNDEFSGCTFGSSTQIVRNLFISCVDATSFLTPEKRSEMFGGTIDSYDGTKDTGNHFYVSETITSRKPITTSLYHFIFLPQNPSVIYVAGATDGKNEGVDVSSCGWKDVPCMHISTAFAHRGSSTTTIKLIGGTHSDAETASTIFEDNTKQFSVEPETSAQKPTKTVSAFTQTPTPAGLFVIKNGAADCSTSTQPTVTFTSLSFSLSTDSPITLPLFSVQSGLLKLDLVDIASSQTTNPVSLSSPALKLNGGENDCGSATLSSCTFSRLSLSSGNGAAISAKFTSQQSLTITSASDVQTSFTQCSVEGDSACGGAIYADSGEEGKFSIVGIDSHKVLFSKCSANKGYGGGIYITTNGTPTSDNGHLPEVLVQHSQFIECSCKSSSEEDASLQRGSSVYLVSPSPAALLLRSRWRGTIDSAASEYVVPFWSKTTDSTPVEDSIVNYLFGALGVPLYIAGREATPNGGADNANCGLTKDAPCETINYAFTQRRAAAFVLLEGAHTAESVASTFTSTLVYAIYKDEGITNEVIIPVTSIADASAIFTVSSVPNGAANTNPHFGVLRLSFSIESLSSPLFHAAGGSLHLVTVTLTPKTAPMNLGFPLLRIDQIGAGTLESCTISGFVLNSGDYEAPVVCAYLEERQRLTLNGTYAEEAAASSLNSFSNCQATNEKGKSGAVYVKEVSSSITLQVSDSTFTDCTCQTKALNIFIDCIDATTVIHRMEYINRSHK